jgi:hypothetical protein
MAANIVLPWTQRAFALMQRWALAAYRGLRRKHITTYLDEFVFRYNRRFHRHVSFDKILGLAAHARHLYPGANTLALGTGQKGAFHASASLTLNGGYVNSRPSCRRDESTVAERTI